MTLIIHHMQVSQSERILWLAEELGLDYKLQLHQRDPMFSPQSIKDLTPLGQSPVIQDGSITLAESAACADYILQKYGNGKLSLPPSHKNFADYLYWFHFANGNLQPQFSRVMTLKFAHVDENESYVQRHFAQLEKFLGFMDDRLKDNKWLAGEEFTAADCMNMFSLSTMRTFYPLDLTKYKNVLRYLEACSERPAYKSQREKGDKGLEVMIGGPAPEQFVEKLRRDGKM